MSISQPLSTLEKPRLVFLDVLKGFALLGIMCNHFFFVSHHAIAQSFQDYPAALFVLCSGYAYALSAKPHHTSLRIRILFLAIIGFLLGNMDTGLDVILINYSIMMLIASLFHVERMRARKLIILTSISVFCGPVFAFWARLGLHNPSIAFQTLAAVENKPSLIFQPLIGNGYYVFGWMSFFLVGVLLYRVRENEITTKCLLCLAPLVFLCTKAFSWLLDGKPFHLYIAPVAEWNQSGAYAGTPMSLLSAGCISIFFFCLVRKFGENLKANNSLSVLGKATLSAYTAHVVIYGFLSATRVNDFLYFGIEILLFWLALSTFQKHFKTAGPVEWLLDYLHRIESQKREVGIIQP